MTRRIRVLIAILLTLLGSSGYWLYQNLERYTRQVNTGARMDAIINSWFAAQAFLKRQNIDSHRAMDLHDMLHRLQPNDTLVLFNDTPIYDTHQQQQLMEWMRQGGHLVLAANYEWDDETESSDDPFLDAMGVRLIWLDDDEGDDDELDDEAADAPEEIEPEAEQAVGTETATNTEAIVETAAPQNKNVAITPACNIDSDADIFRIHYRDNADPLHINFGYAYTLEDASGNLIHDAGVDAEPNGLLEYSVGKGRMTVLLDTDIWTNSTIGDYDHAFFLWHLVEHSPVVWFVASHDSANVLQVLWRNARYLMISLITLLLLWAWRRWVRFGPLIPDPVPERRQLMEHIEASARFNWKHRQMEPLLLRLRDDIWLHLNRHHGIDHQNGNREPALKKLVAISHLSNDIVQHAMTCPAPQRETDWIELISQLQTIRNAL